MVETFFLQLKCHKFEFPPLYVVELKKIKNDEKYAKRKLKFLKSSYLNMFS